MAAAVLREHVSHMRGVTTIQICDVQDVRQLVRHVPALVPVIASNVPVRGRSPFVWTRDLLRV